MIHKKGFHADWIILCGILFFIFTLVPDRSQRIQQREEHVLPEIPQECLQSGYLICRHGDGLWSNIICQKQIDHRFSHIGILSVTDEQVSVIHADTSSRFAISGKVVQEPIDVFLAHAKHIGVFRLKNVDSRQLESKAHHYLGHPFDWKLDAQDKSAIYCSELVKLAIEDTDPKYNFDFKWLKIGENHIIPVDAFITSNCSDELYEWSKKELSHGALLNSSHIHNPAH